jgi:hypothetical protein
VTLAASIALVLAFLLDRYGLPKLLGGRWMGDRIAALLVLFAFGYFLLGSWLTDRTQSLGKQLTTWLAHTLSGPLGPKVADAIGLYALGLLVFVLFVIWLGMLWPNRSGLGKKGGGAPGNAVALRGAAPTPARGGGGGGWKLTSQELSSAYIWIPPAVFALGAAFVPGARDVRPGHDRAARLVRSGDRIGARLMDPISAIFVMTVLGGLFVKGVDVATDGWFSAEVGAGVRGAAGYAVRAERARWGRARAKAREIREQTPHGQAVQEMLDLAGLFGRTLFGELRRFGSGVRSEWETARDQARSARTGRRGDAPWPIVRAARSGAVRAREWAERRAGSDAATPNEAGPFDPNGASSDPEPQGKLWGEVARSGGCIEVTDWVVEGGQRWPRYCGEPREPGWVLCPTHLATQRADHDYPQGDIDEFRADYGDPNAQPAGQPADGDPNDPNDSEPTPPIWGAGVACPGVAGDPPRDRR